MSPRVRLGPLALLALAACGSGEDPARTPPRPGYRPVVRQAIERLDGRIAAAEMPLPIPGPSEETREHVRGLVTFVSSSTGDMRESALEELSGVGPACIAILDGVLHDPDAPAAERLTAAEMLGTQPHPQAAESLLIAVENSGEPVLRARAAVELGGLGQDWVVPRLVLRLKYEKDGGAATAIADSLAAGHNLAGLVGLSVVASADPSAELRSRATRTLSLLSERFGFQDADTLRRAWDEGAGLDRDPAAGRSARYRREVWRLIEGLGDFQLRGVDDGRFVLSRLGSVAAAALAEAIGDESPYVRLHSIQCLERMGPRGREAAAPALIAALSNPELAPNAAAALGSMRAEEALPELFAGLEPGNPLELRVAVARGLGPLGARRGIVPLRGILASDSHRELRQAAAESLLALEDNRAACELLIDQLEDSFFSDSTSAERALREFLARQAESSASPAGEPTLLDRWQRAGESAVAFPDFDLILERRDKRAALLRAALESGELLPEVAGD